MVSRGERHQRLRSFDHNFDFSVDKEDGIQLTERQVQLRQQHLESAAPSTTVRPTRRERSQPVKPFETRSNKNNHSRTEAPSSGMKSVRKEPTNGPRSAASTTLYRSQREDQKALLRKVLASKAAANSSSSARSTASTSAKTPYSTDDRRAFLKRVVAERNGHAPSDSSESDGKSTISTNATSNNGVDQKALLRQVLAKTKAKKQHQQTNSTPDVRASKEQEQRKTFTHLDKRPALSTGQMQKASSASKPNIVATLRQKKNVADSVKSSIQPKEETQQLQNDKFEKISSRRIASDSPNGVLKEESATKLNGMVEDKNNDRSKRKPATGSTPARRRKKGKESSEPLINTSVPKYDMKDITPEIIHPKMQTPHGVATAKRSNRAVSFPQEENMEPDKSPDWVMLTENEEDEKGFADFMDSLKKEVSSDHIELWRSFQSLFYDASKIPQSVPEKPSRIKFDDKTKESLATMNLYIKSASAVECVTETQLVNDKKFAREMRQENSSHRPPLSTKDARESIPQCVSQAPDARQSLTTKEYLEKARKRLSERQNSSRRSESYARLGSPPAARMNMESVSESNPQIDSQEELAVSEWPEPEDDLENNNVSTIDAEVERMDQHEKRKSWLTMYRARNSKPADDSSDDEESDKENETRPQWPALKSSAKPALRPVQNEDKVESSPAQAKRPMPWLVALQERKARLEKQTATQTKEENERSEEAKSIDGSKASISFVEKVQTEQERKGLSSASADSEDMSIARQRSLLDDDTDEDDDILCETPNSGQSLSGRKRRQGSYQAETPVSPQSSVPIWSAVKLRPALNKYPGGNEREQQHDDNLLRANLRDSTQRGYAQSECGVPWSTVKLRPVASKDEDEQKPPAQKEDTLPFRQMLRRVPSAAMRNRTVPSGVRIGDGSDGAPVIPPASSWEQLSSDNETATKDLGFKVGDDIDLSNLPNRLFDEKEPSFVMHLQRTPGMPDTEIASVVVGKRVLIGARSHKDSELSRITWHEYRTHVQSLTLDMSENRADLSLSNNRSKSLSFANAEDCLNFANAFYLTKTLERAIPEHQEESSKSNARSQSDDPGKTTEVMHSPSKKLSMEEEKLLETYRQIRQTNAPEEAMRQTMANKAEDSKPSSLSEEEEKIASRFRKMLKVCIPRDAVLHKMVQEQVSDRIQQAVLGETTSNVDKSTMPSSLAEEIDKAASKYRKMLQMGVPADGVRHKMTKDGVASDIVNAVLGPDTPNVREENKKSSELTDDEEKIASTYRKMLKMMVPADAVRHRMKKDKVDLKIIAAVVGEEANAYEEDKGVPTSSLSENEEKVASGYRKMLKLMVPADAVRHKMTKDKIDPKIVSAVLGDNPDAPKESQGDQATTLSVEEEKIALSYRKMLKMMVPADAVRHRMVKDQVDLKIVSAVLGTDDSGTNQGVIAPKDALSAADQKLVEKFKLMVKRMVPIDAVRHKMEKEKVHPKVIAAVLGPDPSCASKSKLNEEEDRVASTYRKMLKMNVPKEAVRHKMVRDGVKEKVVSAVLCDTSSKPASSANPVVKGSKLVALHWTPLSGKDLDNSVWRASKKRKVDADGSDFSKLVELFQKKSNPRAGKTSAANSSSVNGDGNEMAKLIDLNRANNVAISLKAFKEFTHKELAETIKNLDPQRIVQGERCQFVKDLLPNAAEAKAIKAYKGPATKLVPAEVFFRELVNVPRIDVKVRVMQTMDTFTENARELGSRFRILATVCSQVMGSEKLQDVLEMVLQVGNIMNEGTRTGGAAGFKFDSLLKLTQTKSADGKTTVLDYIVMIFMAKNGRETLQLTAEFPEVQTAGRMALNDMTADVRAMGGSINQCKTELINMKKDGSDRPVTRSMSKRFGGAADSMNGPSAPDPRGALLSAIKARGSAEEKPKSFVKRDPFFSAIQEQDRKEAEERPTPVGELLNAITTCGQMDDVYNSDEEEARKVAMSPRSKMLESIKAKSVRKVKAAVSEAEKKVEISSKSGTHVEGVRRLESFMDEATTALTKLEGDRDAATKACKELSKYCGEGGGERAAIPLIGILSQFAINLDNAVQKYDAMEEARIRRETAMKKRESLEQNKKQTVPKGEAKHSATEQQQSTPKSKQRENKGPSLVLIVNDLLNSASDQAKEDFVKGVVYDKTTDTRLRTIYDRERKSLGGVLMAPEEGRESILSAIKKRRKHDEDEVQTSNLTAGKKASVAV